MCRLLVQVDAGPAHARRRRANVLHHIGEAEADALGDTRRVRRDARHYQIRCQDVEGHRIQVVVLVALDDIIVPVVGHASGAIPIIRLDP